MATKPHLVLDSGTTFQKAGVAAPHEFEHKFKTALPVAWVDCECGYNGLAKVEDGKPVCPREAELKKAQTDSVQQASGTVTVNNNDAIAAIVAETLKQERARVAANGGKS